MPQNLSSPFSSEYTQSGQTVGQVEIANRVDIQGAYQEPSFSVGDETEGSVVHIYGQSKPRRVVLRGKILR